MKTKKIPTRQCLGCGEKKTKQELVRVVKSKEGEITLDTTGKTPGRGAYICHNIDCLAKAQKARRLEKSLSSRIPEQVYEQLEEGLKLGKQ